MGDVRQQEAVELARHIEREEPLFLVQEIGWRVRDHSWALKIYDTITERQAVILDAGTWPRLRAVARTQQRQVFHQALHAQAAVERASRNTQHGESLRHDKQLQMIS